MEPPDTKDLLVWKTKRLLKKLDTLSGQGTSMISLIVRPGEEIHKTKSMLATELGSASNIKSRENRQSVESALTWAIERLKMESKIPPKGLVLYSGMTDSGRIVEVLEPPKPIATSLYQCDKKFHTDQIKELLESDDSYGFIIIDGNGYLFGKVTGNSKEILKKAEVSLPNKHNKGGQSSVRFARLRVEKCLAYRKKVAEKAEKYFVLNGKLNVRAIVLAGCGNQKSELYDLKELHPQIKNNATLVDVSYSGENGFQHAIDQSMDFLNLAKMKRQNDILNKFFEFISKGTEDKIRYGIGTTMRALESNLVLTLIVDENISCNRSEAVDEKGNRVIFYENDESKPDAKIREKYAIDKKQDLLEWLVDNNFNNQNYQLVMVHDKTPEGKQFIMGFGGIGAILRYSCLDEMVEEEEEDL